MSVQQQANGERAFNAGMPERLPGKTPLRLPTAGRYGDSEAYDHYMGRWSLRLARQFVKFAGIGRAESVLDIGSGTGSLTRVIAASTGASRIVGIDPVPQFVATARQRFGDGRVAFDCGDAQALPYADATFDASLAQLVLHHFPDERAAMAEMLRVTASGGTVAACEWESGPGMELFQVIADCLTAVHPQSGRQHSLRHYAQAGKLPALWQHCGFEDVEERLFTVPLCYLDFHDFWTAFIQGPSGVPERLSHLPAEVGEDYRLRLKQRLLGGRQDGPIRLQARAWAVRGRVP